jgi:DNA polymerase-1
VIGADQLQILFSRFAHVVAEDFEFVLLPGERPDVVCGSFLDLKTGQTTLLWRNQLGNLPPYTPGPDTLVVCFVANAEMGCHLALGWPVPKHILDLSPEFKCHVNGKGIPHRNQGLIGALHYFGLSTITPKRKDAMRDRIMEGWPFTPEEQKQVGAYCTGDTDDLSRLLLKLLSHIDLDIALHRGEAVAALARSEHLGVPVDMEIFSQLADKKTWRGIRDAMVPLVDVNGIYARDKQGEWHWNNARFEGRSNLANEYSAWC